MNLYSLENRNNIMQRVLITAIGTMNCTTIISELKKHKEEFYLIGADINNRNYVANSKEVNEYYVFPKITDDQKSYYEFLKLFCIDKNIDIIYCVIDEEVVLLSKHRKELQSLGITLCIANDEVITLCHNKNLFSKWIEENFPKLYIRRFNNQAEISASDYPVFIKPIEGRASIGCKKIKNKLELQAYISEWNKYIVQEYIDSPIVAVDVVSNQVTGQVEISQRIELLRNSNGCGIAVQIIDNEDIKNYCIKIVEKLKLNGIINIEFFITEEGPKIIEINPRIPAGVEYSCLSGLNVVMNALHISKGEPCSFAPIKVGRYYTKRYETVSM